MRHGTTTAQNEDRLIPFSEVPSLEIIPRRRGGSRLSSATVYRWTIKGVKGTRLRAIKVGNQWVTKKEWLLKFFEDLAAEELRTLNAN